PYGRVHEHSKPSPTATRRPRFLAYVASGFSRTGMAQPLKALPRMRARAIFRIVIPLLICLALMGTPAFGAPPVDGDDQPARAPIQRAALTSLYISFATLQGLDAHSTLRAAEFGGLEGNPIFSGVV